LGDLPARCSCEHPEGTTPQRPVGRGAALPDPRSALSRRGHRLRARAGRGRSWCGCVGGGGAHRCEAALLALAVRLRLLVVALALPWTRLLVVVRNAALVGGAQNRKGRGQAEAGGENRQLARSQLHVVGTSMANWLPTPKAPGSAGGLLPSGARRAGRPGGGSRPSPSRRPCA